MRVIGLLGGTTWHSTATYYDRINRQVAERLGAFRSAELVLRSLDYGEVRTAREDGNWTRFGRGLVRRCRSLVKGGAEGIVLCSNTVHRFAPQIESQVDVPVLHIADALADHAHGAGIDHVALFGTAFTMTRPFYRKRLEGRGLTVSTPEPEAIERLDTIILEHLAAGDIRQEHREVFVEVMGGLAAQGAQAMVLGCTEIGLLIRPADVDVPTLDTALIHADAAVDWALG